MRLSQKVRESRGARAAGWPRAGGFTLVEAVVVVGVVGVLAGLSYVAVQRLPQRIRVSGEAVQLEAALSSARSLAYGRNERVAVLLNLGDGGATQPLRYWTVADPDSTLDDALATSSSWARPEDLVPPSPPAPASSRFAVLDSGQLNPLVSLYLPGYRGLVSGRHRGCTSAVTRSILPAEGTIGSGNSFPPPFCFVPDDAGCTFCSGSASLASPLRGVIFFEPDGEVLLTDASGRPSPASSGSLVLRARDSEVPFGQALVLTRSGLVRSFSPGR